MPDPTSVNSQITDAVTQTKLMYPDELAALTTMGRLLEKVAEALREAEHEASAGPTAEQIIARAFAEAEAEIQIIRAKKEIHAVE